MAASGHCTGPAPELRCSLFDHNRPRTLCHSEETRLERRHLAPQLAEGPLGSQRDGGGTRGDCEIRSLVVRRTGRPLGPTASICRLA
jgi:hypothetical protein